MEGTTVRIKVLRSDCMEKIMEATFDFQTVVFITREPRTQDRVGVTSRGLVILRSMP